MILTCPSCGTQYVVKDGAIPPGGRQVRCAACKHSWHENPEATADTPPEAEAEAGPETQPEPEAAEPVAADPLDHAEPAPEEESIAEATMIEPRSGPEAEERAYEEAQVQEADRGLQQAGEDFERGPGATYENSQFDIAKPQDERAVDSDWKEPPSAEAQDDEFTPFPEAGEAEPRRRSPILSILIVIVAVIILAAAFWYLAPPTFKARLGLAELGTTPLALVTTHMDRQRLESGNELLTVSGRVINPTGKQQDVPPLQAQLKTRDGKIVYSWTIPPPAQSLAPGASASFNSAELKVPPGGEELTITLGAKAG
jgi:predicted Zn finger-like uncharacterized protein